MNSNEMKQNLVTNISFFWYWIYPFVLCLLWGLVLSIIILFLNKSVPSDEYLSVFLTIVVLVLILWILFETPFNAITAGIIWGLVYNLFRAAGIGFIVFPVKLFVELLYFVFIWPITLLDKIGKPFIHQNRYTIGRWSLRVAAIEFNEWRNHINSNYRLLFCSLFISDEDRYQSMEL